MQSDTLEERYAIKLCFKLGKNTTETYGMLQTAFGASCMNRSSVFEWHKRFKEGRESVRDDERCRRSREVNTPELIGQRVRVRLTMLRFKGSSFFRDSLGRGQHFSNRLSGISTSTMAPVHNSILITDYLSKLGIKTVPQSLYSPDLALCDFWFFPKLTGCRYEIIEEMKEAVTKVIDMLTQEDFHGAFQKLLEQQLHCNRRILVGRGLEFHVCTINKIAHTKKRSGNLSYTPRILANAAYEESVMK